MSEFQDKIVQVSCKVAVTTGKELLYLLPQLVRRLHNRDYKIVHGEQKLKTLNRQNREIQGIPITDEDTSKIKRQLKTYSVDFSAMRQPDGTMMIYFKTQDVDRVYTALKNVVKNLGADKSRRLAPTIEAAKAKVQNTEREPRTPHRVKQKNKDVPAK